MYPSPPPLGEPPADPALRRILEAAGLPTTGYYRATAGWVSRAWIGEDYVVRLNTDERFRDAYRHEAHVVALLTGSEIPHARHIAHGDGPDGPWYVSERLPGRTLHEAWPAADATTRRSLIESLGDTLHALHHVPVPVGLLPPWLARALSGGPWPAYHPPVVSAMLQQVDAARQVSGHDPSLLAEVAEWIGSRLPLFAADDPVLVHGDVHGSNVIVEGGRVTGLINLAEAVAQPADAELDTILRWCARPQEFPPTPRERGLDRAALSEVPRWLRETYPELFAREQLRERLDVYDMSMELAIHAHHPEAGVRDVAQERIARLLAGCSHLDDLHWSAASD
ncbi:phosphotransferase family protein [Brachybacterium sp. P6-10-X1]|uniref:phosphotransferase family protein n=1 Tax=Brachybacterium sp. P6-10-X1 TaxID=1903186 RepID=UPI001C12BAB5|nr:phosphotransferase [Brachybacterium sp. P6-10-X1]